MQNCYHNVASFATGSWILCQRLKTKGWNSVLTSIRTTHNSIDASNTTLTCSKKKVRPKQNKKKKKTLPNNYTRDTVLILEDKQLVTVNCALLCIWVFALIQETLAKRFSLTLSQICDQKNQINHPKKWIFCCSEHFM